MLDYNSVNKASKYVLDCGYIRDILYEGFFQKFQIATKTYYLNQNEACWTDNIACKEEERNKLQLIGEFLQKLCL